MKGDRIQTKDSGKSRKEPYKHAHKIKPMGGGLWQRLMSLVPYQGSHRQEPNLEL